MPVIVSFTDIGLLISSFSKAHEDPMYDVIRENKRHEKEMR